MRTSAIEALGLIAVMAEDLKALGIIVLSKPSIELMTPPNFGAMSVAATIYVIDRKKMRMVFTATGALAAVCGQYFCSQFGIFLALSLGNLFGRLRRL
jgi:hypothetical protein